MSLGCRDNVFRTAMYPKVNWLTFTFADILSLVGQLTEIGKVSVSCSQDGAIWYSACSGKRNAGVLEFTETARALYFLEKWC